MNKRSPSHPLLIPSSVCFKTKQDRKKDNKRWVIHAEMYRINREHHMNINICNEAHNLQMFVAFVLQSLVNFINMLQAAFALIFFYQKITKPNCNKRKVCKINFYKKAYKECWWNWFLLSICCKFPTHYMAHAKKLLDWRINQQKKQWKFGLHYTNMSLEQWFPTGVPRHTRVPWEGARDAANF
jgi:hypothetical protein